MKKYFLPLIIFWCLGIIFSVALYVHKATPIINVTGKNISTLVFTDINSHKLVMIPPKSIIHVFSTWCESCKRDLLHLQKLKRMYNIQVIGLLFNDSIKNVLDWQKRKNHIYNMIVKSEDEAIIKLAVLGTPEVLLLDQEGNIVFSHKGELNEEEIDVLRSKLDKM